MPGIMASPTPMPADTITITGISLMVLGVTALMQAAVVVSGSVALLGDALHNAADALTALPLGVTFVAGRRPLSPPNCPVLFR
jgi:divalent metal cation (Fe/Co/Zn/Cd) transporter